MRGRAGWRACGALALWLAGSSVVEAQRPASKAAGACHRAVIDGEVQAGKGFEHKLGNGLEVMVEPIAAGWILRVVPAAGPRGEHDYAELATPPYRSVNPLLLSTDFSFRAQDVVAWNPRRFHFAANAAAFARMAAAYGEYSRTAVAPAKAQGELASLSATASEGTIQILDSRIIPGTADQAPMAAMVASHFAETAHTVEQPADGGGLPLGRVTWLRFRVTLDLPAGFVVDRSVVLEPRSCR